jgi:cytochrome P450
MESQIEFNIVCSMALPIPFEFDPYSVDVQENPYPYYAVLRRDAPVYWVESAKCWALSRYDDIAMACSDPARYSSARGNVLDDDPAPVTRPSTIGCAAW